MKTSKSKSLIAAQSARQNAMLVGYSKWVADGKIGSLIEYTDRELVGL